MSTDTHATFSDLSRAAYCPRQLHHARRDDDRAPDDRTRARTRLAFRYDDLLDAPAGRLADLPVDPDPPTYRARLRRLRDRDEWAGLVDPDRRRVRVEGRDCRGVVDKVIDGPGAPTPTVVSPGRPPERGAWETQRVRAVAAATALAWEHEAEVERALVEYPAHPAVRTVRLTTRNRVAYRDALRTIRRLDDGAVGGRTDDRSKCESCPYREPCGPPGRSLRGLL